MYFTSLIFVLLVNNAFSYVFISNICKVLQNPTTNENILCDLIQQLTDNSKVLADREKLLEDSNNLLKDGQVELQDKAVKLELDSMQVHIQTIKLEKELREIKANKRQSALPIDFIYTQLPKEKMPIEIWPQYKWQDITPAYSGVFFRALGSGSGDFGKVQEDASPRLYQIEQVNEQPDHFVITQSIEKGGWASTDLWSNGGTQFWWKYYVSDSEVRPRNMAIRIWKLTA